MKVFLLETKVALFDVLSPLLPLQILDGGNPKNIFPQKPYYTVGLL